MHIYPVILSGGSGTRLWPLSREATPKQFLPLLKGRSPFQATLERLRGIDGLQPPLIISGEEHRFLVLEQLKAAGITPLGVYLEPCGRNTAPAAAVAAISLLGDDPDALMLILPADHDIADTAALGRAVYSGAAAAQAQWLVVFGVEARWPETGYGYIERGAALASPEGCYHVANFIEKPEIEMARRYVASGRHYWNSGMFLFGAARYVSELRHLQPELEAVCQDVAGSLIEDQGCCRIDSKVFARCRSVSIDYAVLEHTDAAAVVPAAFRWSDIGSWNALWDCAEKDGQGNVTEGDVHVTGVSNSYIASTRRMVVGIGLENMVIVETPDALLVADRREAQCVRQAVERLKSQGRAECSVHRMVQRPWGHYEDVDAGERFRVKRITVRPGGQLSLQVHHHRAEHWVVVSGTARVTRGEEVILLTENQSTFIPVGMRHRLENPGKIPLDIIEVQSGAYLAEDDIVRIEDAYHRT